ncbi:hypothetical protein AVEN_265710-1 [Araneus ventricosus]|uniref:STPR domain-containing protein n=1 Tax=Araneus ventricosus TaxID=182803 RepID=A0A4Y2UDP1_ARAVE|nr:hypothetical protein AVEN_265710-1 [Araneus ventricosus]
MLPVDGRQLKRERRVVETEVERSRRLSTMAQRGQDRRAEETEEQRNSRLSDMAQRSQERRAKEIRRTKEWSIADIVTIFALQFSLPDAQKKRGITGDAASDGRQLLNVKGELLKLKKKEAADCQPWHNVAWTEERKKQKNQAIADCQTWHNVGSREERQKNKEIDDWQ